MPEFHSLNFGYVLELYDRYRRDPASVDEATRAFFAGWRPPSQAGFAPPPQADFDTIVAVANLAQAIRSLGHLAARLDPLGGSPPGDPALETEFHGLSEIQLRELPASLVGGPLAQAAANASEALQALRQTYSSTIGYDYEHIRVPDERAWLRDAAESGRFRPPHAPIDPRRLLERLTQVEVFEHFLHRIFPGKTRFSIEGVDLLAPMLDEIIGAAAQANICMIFIGMAHRGRLNILANVLRKPYAHILAEFKDPRGAARTWDELGWTGDVKYHKGGQRAVEEGEVVELIIAMQPNPSHLEHVNPVVAGMARAAAAQVDRAGAPVLHPQASLPILIHGDAAFPGQGVVAETLNFSRLPGYTTFGTLHLITNNQLGFTATAAEERSTLYASDLAKGFKIPVIHVNADDPEACLEAARTAFAYRARFQKDFLIDLIGYRRYGHNEGDEPAFTQPLMYQTIREHPSAREQWARTLRERGVIESGWPDERVQQGMEQLRQVYESLQAEEALVEPHPQAPPRGAARRAKTVISLEQLRELNEVLLRLPDGFNLHPKLERAMRQRRQAFDDPDAPGIDWATAEELALAAILQDGAAIRLTGEDVARGTFSQRHAVFHDVLSGETHTPLQVIPQARAAFEVLNSPLSENAAIGFEFGYNVQAPDRLVIWEAQYGDFINVAQAMIDEFLVSARAKWGQTPSLVLLLPHGNEGQGPDHSSARPERFLALAAETNLRLANPTSAAQYFHLLRRQAALLKTDPLPLVILTPKGLLRHPRVASRPRELAEGSWQPVLEVPRENGRTGRVRRLLLCSGRIYIDLVNSKQWENAADVALARIEQLYPFPADELKALIDAYPQLEQVVWVQEEPQNMGAWEYLRPRLSDLLDGRVPLGYVGRPVSSSPAEGSAAWYAATQRDLIERAYNPELQVVDSSALLER